LTPDEVRVLAVLMVQVLWADQCHIYTVLPNTGILCNRKVMINRQGWDLCLALYICLQDGKSGGT
jgi:hypothetical protein